MKNIMRILHIGEFNFENDTGSGTAVFSLIQGLRQFETRVKVIKGYSKPTPNEIRKLKAIGAEIDFIGGTKKQSYLRLKEECNRILAWQPDVVHFHSAFIPLHPLIAFELRKKGIPYIITTHGALDMMVLKRNQLKKKVYMNILEMKYFEGASGFVALSKGERDDILKLSPMANINIIPNAISLDTIEFCNKAFTLRKLLTSKKINALFLGRYDVYQKGIDFLINLIAQLQKNDIPIKLETHGVEPIRRMGQINEIRGNNSNVNILGPVYGKEKLEVFIQSNMYMQTSRWEGFGMSIVEAMASGLPVVVSETMNIAPFVKDSEGGIVVPFDILEATDILKNILDDEKLLNKMGANGRKYVLKNLNPQTVASKTKDFYKSIIECQPN